MGERLWLNHKLIMWMCLWVCVNMLVTVCLCAPLCECGFIWMYNVWLYCGRIHCVMWMCDCVHACDWACECIGLVCGVHVSALCGKVLCVMCVHTWLFTCEYAHFYLYSVCTHVNVHMFSVYSLSVWCVCLYECVSLCICASVGEVCECGCVSMCASVHV